MNLDFRQLEVFAAIVKLGSFTKAAKRVHLSQATVSERIAALEESVGVKLLDRQSKSITPTKAGELLYRHARELLRMRQQACLELEELIGVKRGSLHIGGSTIPGEHILPCVLGQFRERYPGIAVQLSISSSSEIARRVVEGDLELGVVGAPGGPKTLLFEKLWRDELVLVVPSSHRWAGRSSIALSELPEGPFIAREPGSGTREILDRHIEHHGSTSLEDLDLAAELGSSTAVKNAILSSLGVSVLSSRAVEDEVESGRLAIVPMTEGPIWREFYLIRDRRRSPSPLCKVFSKLLCSEEKKGPGRQT